MSGDIEEVEGRQGKGRGGATGSHGGRGEEFKDQHVGKGRRIEEGDDRYGGTGVDSSAERAGPEDCRHGHLFCIGKRAGNMVDCRMIGTEDRGTSGVSFSENVGVGGHEHYLCVVEKLQARSGFIAHEHVEN